MPAAADISTTNRAPPSGASSIHIRPPWSRRCSTARARPSPVPGVDADQLTAGEPLEQSISLVHGDARPTVVDREQQRRLGPGHHDSGRSTGVRVGVVQQVGEHLRYAALVHGHGRRGRREDLDGHLVLVPSRRAPRARARPDPRRSGVRPRRPPGAARSRAAPRPDR